MLFVFYGILYLIFSIISASFNISHWEMVARITYGIIAIIALIVVSSILIEKWI